MCTGSSALVRSVIAAAAACGIEVERARVDVGEHRPRALVERSRWREATNENGDVTTSSPSDTPTARSARCSAAVPDETALAWRAPSARGERLLEGRHARAERELARAQHLDHRGLLLGSPSTGRASGITSSAALTRAPLRAPAGAPRARQHAGLERVHQRVPARLDHVLVHADRAPRVACRRRRRAARA